MPARAATSANRELTDPEQDTHPTVTPKSVSASKRPVSEAGMEEQAAKTQAPTAVQPVEPEDAYLTGVSRSLQRRLLGLNVEGARPQSKPVPGVTSAGLHSTGSYTETEGVKQAASKPAKNTKKS